MKQAIVVVSFGTTIPTALQTIASIEQTIAQHYNQPVFRAFTSRFICKKLLERDALDIPDPITLFSQLSLDETIAQILCVPTHVIPGFEYEALVHTAAQFPKVKMAKPLLWSLTDYQACVSAVMQMIPDKKEDEALLLMGHGTEHFANAAYCQLEHTFHTAGFTDVFVGTVEGYPTISHILPSLKKNGFKKAILMPFLIVTGEHAMHDLNGSQPDSWRSLLNNAGIQTRSILIGLGDNPAIAALFLQHISEL